jgi:putative exosortase-associated protein (TIGR04073 family)
MKRVFLLFFLSLLMPAFLTFAAAEDTPDRTKNGFIDLALGWTEIPKKIVEKTNETNPLQGLLLGTWEGTARALARTTNGIADMATFPIGKYERPAVFPDISKANK